MGQSSSSYQFFDKHESGQFHQTPGKPPPRPPPRPPKPQQSSQGGLPSSLQQLLQDVENECSNKIDTVRNIRESYFEGAGEYLLDLLKTTEKELHEFNLTKKWPKSPEHEKNKRLYSTLTEFKKENQKLEEENKRLKSDKRYLDGPIERHESEGFTRQADGQSAYSQSSNQRGGKDKERNISQNTVKNYPNPELQEKVNLLQASVDSLQGHCDTQEANIRDLLGRNRSLTVQKDDLLLRLSKISGERLVKDNPAIANLSDPNRPTKLGEVYSEIYDNEWTDAFESLQQAGYQEEEAINTLRLTLLNVFQFCSRKSEKLLTKTEEAINILFEEYKETKQQNMPRHLTMPKNVADRWGRFARQSLYDDYLSEIRLQEMWKPRQGHKEVMHTQASMKVTKPEVVVSKLKIFRKEVAESMVPIVQKAYLKASWNDRAYIYNLKPYIKKCLFLGWMMVVQSPPMTLAQCEPGERFNKDIYREYTASGSCVSYVVWPALLLNKDGPVVGRGVAQGKRQ